jgi:protein O-GlcNAc transferase
MGHDNSFVNSWFAGDMDNVERTIGLLIEKSRVDGAEVADAKFYLAHAKDRVCDWAEKENDQAELSTIINKQINNEIPIGLFPLCYYPLELTPSEYKSIAKLQDARVKRLFDQQYKPFPDYFFKDDGRLRIGYVSIDFRSHSGGISLREPITLHNRDRFHVSGYSFAPRSSKSSVEREYAAAFDRFTYLGDLDICEAARQIHADGIQILIDTSRHILGWPSGLWPFKSAPIQVSAWGYGATTGSPHFDYLFSDQWLSPPEGKEYCCESVICLDNYHPISKPTINPLLARDGLGLQQKAIVFANFNNPYKINPELFSVWLRLLQEIDGSVLWLPDGNAKTKANLRETTRLYGVSEERLVFAERVCRERHIARLAAADIVLDNPRLGGGASSVDSLWAGTPVVSYAGSNMDSRNGLSILNAFGLSELVAEDIEGYFALACELAKNPLQLSQLRSRIRKSTGMATLFPLEKFVERIEDAYQEMWENYLRDAAF